jgi:hypothetical protein
VLSGAIRARLLITLVTAGMLAAGCDSQASPQPPKEQIKDVVLGFFEDTVKGDLEGACGKLTGSGRAIAIGRGSAIGRLPRPVSQARCVRGHFLLRDSTELPRIVNGGFLHVTRVEIDAPRARAFTRAGEYRGVQRMRETRDGWKIELFDQMVHH